MAGKALVRTLQPAKQLAGEIVVPGDKSISHRAAIVGSLTSGITEIRNFSPGKDCSSTLNCLKSLGVRIGRKASDVYIHGVGMGGLQEARDVLSAGNSATTMRLLSGILAAQYGTGPGGG
jgi:3-phosphoshikimate 1-carboxyvinyltransferase